MANHDDGILRIQIFRNVDLNLILISYSYVYIIPSIFRTACKFCIESLFLLCKELFYRICSLPKIKG